jgi:tetratricopeptide (TPR) repeat protein
VVYLEQKQYQKARDCFEQRMLISRDIGDRSGINNMHCNIGLVEMNLGNLQTALEHFISFLEGCKASGDRHNLAKAYNSLGECYLKIGDLSSAGEHCLSAIRLATELGDGHYLPTYLLGLAEVYFAAGRYDESRASAEKAEALNKESGAFKNTLPLTVLLARLDAMNGAEQAEINLRQLLETHRQPYQQAEIYCEIYRISKNIEDRNKALQLYRQALEENPLDQYRRKIVELTGLS